MPASGITVLVDDLARDFGRGKRGAGDGDRQYDRAGAAAPLETATEKLVTPAWPGAGAKTSSPVSRLKVMLAGSGWGVIVYGEVACSQAEVGQRDVEVPPTATDSGS